MRWNKPRGGDAAKPNAYVVKLAELRSHLPADHPTVTPAERAITLERRRQAYNRRTNPAGLARGLEGEAAVPPRLPVLGASR